MDAKKYEMLGGGTVRGNTPKEIVGALRFSSFNPMSSDEIFMNQMSKCCKFYKNATVRVESCEAFVEDLIEFGFLWEVSNG